MQQALDALILEDEIISRSLIDLSIKHEFPAGKYAFVDTSQEFSAYLAGGGRAEMYFLDDWVPDTRGVVNPSFQKHHEQLLAAHPKARVFYHGTFASKEQEKYLSLHAIECVERSQIPRVMRELLTH